MAQCYDEVTNLLDYHNYDVRASAIEAAGYFLIAYHKAGTAEAEVKFTEGWSVFLDQMVTVVKEEDEHQVVIAALDIISEILKQCGAIVTRQQAHIDKILGCVKRIMKGECACQDIEVDDGDEEEAEQDEMLFEYAGEIIPNLGKALTPQTFAPYFTGKWRKKLAFY